MNRVSSSWVIYLIPLTVISATILIPTIFRPRQPSNEAKAMWSLRVINAAEARYRSAYGGNYGDIGTLVLAGALESRFARPMDGYNFSISTDGAQYSAQAIPASPKEGRYGYYSTDDAVIRYSPSAGLAPPGQAGNPAY